MVNKPQKSTSVDLTTVKVPLNPEEKKKLSETAKALGLTETLLVKNAISWFLEHESESDD